VLLVRNAGRLVSREELRCALWGETAVEWGTGLHQVIRQVRVALDDRARSYVQTVPRRGYRFAAEVEPLATSTPGRVEGGRARDVRLYAAGIATPIALLLLLVIACALLAG